MTMIWLRDPRLVPLASGPLVAVLAVAETRLDGFSGPAPRAPAPGGRTGHGLVGMRERLAMVNGSLHAGPEPDGGFAVRARFPLPRGW